MLLLQGNSEASFLFLSSSLQEESSNLLFPQIIWKMSINKTKQNIFQNKYCQCLFLNFSLDHKLVRINLNSAKVSSSGLSSGESRSYSIKPKGDQFDDIPCFTGELEWSFPEVFFLFEKATCLRSQHIPGLLSYEGLVVAYN
jgi:hypothetical protein